MSARQAILEVKSQHINEPPFLVQSLDSEVRYIYNCCKNTRTSLHRGQRKLFNALLFFLTKYARDDDVCVYAGSAPGDNIQAVAELFPTVRFFLYDSKKTKTSNLKNVTVVLTSRGEGSKFTDQILTEFIDIRDKVLFFSDIRNVDSKGDVTETIVHSDLMLQLSWIEKLKPRAFSLKFRLPYIDPSTKTKTFNLEYIDGLGVLQPYAPVESTEIRLMNESKDIFDTNGKLKMIKWRLTTHENRMFYINTILREWAYYDNVDEDVIGGDHCFDCALETLYCNMFLNRFGDAKFDAIGKTPTGRFRNWISSHNKLKLTSPEEPALQSQPEYQKIKSKFQTGIKEPHGELPLQNRDVDLFLKIVSPVTLFGEILEYRGNTNLTKKDIASLLTKNQSLLDEAITHKSMNVIRNYERLEFRGDRILSNCIADYFFEKTSTNDISILNGLLSAFTSGETAAELFAEKLGLKQIIIVNEEECCLDSVAEDVFEASLAAINIIFNRKYGKSSGLGITVCNNIISSILNEINFSKFELKIFPPKTELKELFNEYQSKGFNFEKQYFVTIGNGKHKDVYDTDKIRVEIRLPPELSAYAPPIYEEYGPKARVERNASLLFLEFFKNRGIIPRPKNRNLELLKK